MIRQLAADVAEDLRRHRMSGRGVTLKYKTESFDVRTKIVQLHQNTDDGTIIASAALKLLPVETHKLRLLGVRMSQLISHDSKDARLVNFVVMRFSLESIIYQSPRQEHDSQAADG